MTIPPAGLLLSDRTGLSADVAYLREAYPQPQWRAHSNFGELASFWLQVHDSLRQQGGELARLTTALRAGAVATADFQRAFVPRLNHFLQHLDGHHRIEDSAYFPRFRALDPRMLPGFALLENDHEIIHAALLASVDSARALIAALAAPGDAGRFAADTHAAAADRLAALLDRHLADEEELVIPAMLEHGERSIG